MSLLTCECVKELPVAGKLDAIYCAFLELVSNDEVIVDADLLLVFTDGTVDGLLNAANLQASTISASPGTWTKARVAAINHTFLRSDPKTLPFTYSVNGTEVASVTNALEFDLTVAPAFDWEGFKWTVGAVFGDVTLQYFAIFDTDDGASNTAIDTFVLQDAGGAFCVPQTQRSMPSQAGTQGYVVAHTGVGFDATGNAAIPNGICLVTCRYNKTDSLCEVVLQDGATLALIGTSIKASGALGNLSSMLMQDYLTFFGGTVRLYAVALNWSTAPLPLGPLTVPVATVPVATQTAISEVTFTFTGIAMMYKIERSSNGGVSWSTLVASQRAQTYVDSTVVDLTTYLYRVTGMVGTASSSVAVSNSVTVNNAIFPWAIDTFESYPNAPTDLNGLGNWVANVGGFTEALRAGDHTVECDAANQAAYYSGVISEDQRSEVTIAAIADPGYGLAMGAVVRCNGALDTFYAAGVYYSGGVTRIGTFKCNAGVLDIGPEFVVPIVAMNKIALEVSGSGAATRLRVQKDIGAGWVDVGANIDPGVAYIAGGNPGLWGYAQFGNDSTIRVGAWRAYEL